MKARLGKSYSLRVLVYFLAASLAPLLALSAALTSIAQSALERSLEERGRTAAWAFSERVSEIEGRLDASLASLAASPLVLEALGARARGPLPPEPSAALLRLLRRESLANGGAVFSLAPASGGLGWSSGEFPADWEQGAYAEWGLSRRVREAGGRTALMARPRRSREGRAYSLAAGRLLRAADGEALGMVAAELPRELLVAAAGRDRELLAFDAEILGRGGVVAFCLTDPSREGSASLLPPFAPPPASGIYEARLGELVVRLLFPESLASSLGASMRRATAWGLGAAALGAALLALLAARLVTRPVLALAGTMARVRAGELGATVAVSSQDELGLLSSSFNAMSAELRELVRTEAERAELLRRVELEALAARMNPHFLYNTLNSIKSLAKLGMTEEIVATVSRLGKLLRASAAGAGGESTVGAEIEFARDYLEIVRIRYGERVEVSWEIEPEIEALPLPGLVLEPIVENAILHSLERSTRPWHLSVRGRIEGETALIAFEDDGPGAGAEFFEAAASLLERGLISEEGAEGGGDSVLGPRLGLAATNRRLLLRFGPGYGLRLGRPLAPAADKSPAAAAEAAGAAAAARAEAAEAAAGGAAAEVAAAAGAAGAASVAAGANHGRGFRVELRIPAQGGPPRIP